MAQGQGFVIDNDSSGILALQDGSTASLGSVTPGMAVYVFCENNSTTAGSWSGYMFVPGGGPGGQVTWGTSGLSMGGQAITNANWNGVAVPVLYGGTGLTSVTANQIPYGNGTSALSTSSGLTFDGTNLLSTNNVNAYRDGWTAAIIAALTNSGGCNSGGPSTTFSSAVYGGNSAQLFASSSTGTPSGFKAIVDSSGLFPTIQADCGNNISVAWQSSIPSYWGRVYGRSALSASFY
jgi:hypothetical protein